MPVPGGDRNFARRQASQIIYANESYFDFKWTSMRRKKTAEMSLVGFFSLDKSFLRNVHWVHYEKEDG